MPITIQEIIASDTISQLVDKTNFNFDQLLLNGGGPAGPAGIAGPTGPAGGRGPKGSRWYEDISTVAPGATPIASPPTATPLVGDYYLQLNGQVWEYTGLTWSVTTINLIGPQGPQGAGGGMGDVFGGPNSILQETAIYNGPIGYDINTGVANGATTLNQGIATVMIGGAVTTTTSLPAPLGLTNAFIIPDNIALGAQSNNVSLLIHQKDSGSKSIVFQGGGAIAGDNYYQGSANSGMTDLSNITIGIDDRLVLDAPKTATNPTTLNDMIGFEVNTVARSQNYAAGKAISFKTGERTIQDFGGENSDFNINVGTGSNAGGSKFNLSTVGTAGTTLIQAGTGFAVVTTQAAQVGDTQIRSGRINLVSSAAKNIQLYSGGAIILDTRSGSSPSGTVSLRGGSGGISLDANSTGNINIAQTNTSAANTGDINISNASTALNTTVGGDIYIQTNSQTILKKTTSTALADCSIVIDYGYDGSAGAQPHTRFVGKQTIATSGLGAGTFPPDGFANLIYKNPVGAMGTSTTKYELTGNAAVTDMTPGSMAQAWQGGTQALSGIDAGLLAIALGSEGPSEPVQASDFAFDNSLGFSVRDSSNTNEYFTASKNKIAFATPWVLKRAVGRNSSTNSAPQTIYSPNTTAPAPINYGWNTRQQLTPQASTTAGTVSPGMPTSEQLTVPFISLNFGVGMGYVDSGATFSQSNVNYNYKVNFPTGAYPGQRLLLKFYVQPVSVVQDTKVGGTITISNYGSVDLRIPQFRIKSPQSNGNWTSWWNANLSSQTANGFQVITVGSSASDAGLGIGRYRMIDMIWDGQYITQVGAEVNLGGQANGFTTQTQHGWAVISDINKVSSFVDNALVAISGYDNAPSCFVAGTEIALANGDIKNIEDILSGEEVITWNESKQSAEVGTVGKLNIIENVATIIKLTFDNGTVLNTTEHHPFYHRDGENIGLIDAGELTPGMSVLSIDKTETKVESIKEESGNFTVYNLIDVSGNHNFYVNEILVHNKA